MIRTAAVVLVLLAVATACGRKPPAGDAEYVELVTSARAAKDAMLAGAADSPVPAADRGRFLPLAYFSVDPSYAVPAGFDEAPPGQRLQLELQTSTHQIRRMERVGVLRFTLHGQRLQLGAFMEADSPPDRLFVPFTDSTTGAETYRAGRYLDIERTPTGLYALDFNRAYNPYCYYNPTYDCPYPPKENRLLIAIRAGEKVR